MTLISVMLIIAVTNSDIGGFECVLQVFISSNKQLNIIVFLWKISAQYVQFFKFSACYAYGLI